MIVTKKENYTEYRVFDEFGFIVAVFVYVNIANKIDLFTYVSPNEYKMQYVGHVSI